MKSTRAGSGTEKAGGSLRRMQGRRPKGASGEGAAARLLRGMSTDLISDALDEAGYRDQAMDPTVRPLFSGASMVGPAFTILNAPVYSEPNEPYGRELDALDRIPSGHIAIVAMGSSIRACFWGELVSTAAIARGAIGAVIDGYVRDALAIRGLKFPVFALGSWTVDSKGRSETTAFDCPVRCGGVLVNPGDIVVGDEDGVIVIPKAALAEVVQRASTKATQEIRTRTDLERGLLLREVFKRHGTL